MSVEQWWTDEDVAVAWTAVDRHTAPHQETGEAHNSNARLTNDVLAALAPTVERIRREAEKRGEVKALRGLARDLGLCAECADEADLKADATEAGGDDE